MKKETRVFQCSPQWKTPRFQFRFNILPRLFCKISFFKEFPRCDFSTLLFGFIKYKSQSLYILLRLHLTCVYWVWCYKDIALLFPVSTKYKHDLLSPLSAIEAKFNDKCILAEKQGSKQSCKADNYIAMHSFRYFTSKYISYQFISVAYL